MKIVLTLIVLLFATLPAIAQEPPLDQEAQAQENREWLLAHMHALNNYNEKNFLKVERKLKRMSASQLRVLRQAAEIRMSGPQGVGVFREDNVQQRVNARQIYLMNNPGPGNSTPYSQYPTGYSIGNGIPGPCVRTKCWQFHGGRWYYDY